MSDHDFNYRVTVNAGSLNPSFELKSIVDKGFEFYDDAESYFYDQEAVFEGDYDGNWLRISLFEGPSEIKCVEANEPHEPDEFDF